MRISLAVAALLSFAVARRGGKKIKFEGDCDVAEFPAEKGAFGACCVGKDEDFDVANRPAWFELDEACDALTFVKGEEPKPSPVAVGNCCRHLEDGEDRPDWCPRRRGGRKNKKNKDSESSSECESVDENG